MLSYHGDATIKTKFALRFAAHRAADDVIQGTGFDGSRGCFVGCTLDNYDHAQFPIELGWPEWLARLADKIFEGIPKAEAAQFGTDLLAAVPVGVDLEPVRFHLALARHQIQIERLRGNPEPYAAQCIAALEGVIAFCKQSLDGFSDEAAWSAARSAAWSAAESAAAWSAARSAAWSGESAAWSAAWSGERDALLAILRTLGE